MRSHKQKLNDLNPGAPEMNKARLIVEIAKRNTSATAEFLSQFAVTDLAAYLAQLTKLANESLNEPQTRYAVS